LENIA
jgi:hypothetical protein